MVPGDILDRFRRDLDALVPAGTPIGIAVSGGPDSLALLHLAAEARPGELAGATVDHGLRIGSGTEAQAVGKACDALGVPHSILTIEWDETPRTGLQEQARSERYKALAKWMRDRGLGALLTGHHLDDQVETLVMRLNRGSGARGLAAIRPISTVPGTQGLALVRPLLGWRRFELEQVCADVGATAIADPSNSDPRHERVRVRQGLASSTWLDAQGFAKSAANLAAADEALDWAAGRVSDTAVTVRGPATFYNPADVPAEISRRIVGRIIHGLATEGRCERLRGHELDGLMNALRAGEVRTLRGVRCEGGANWRFSAAPPRRLPKG